MHLDSDLHASDISGAIGCIPFPSRTSLLVEPFERKFNDDHLSLHCKQIHFLKVLAEISTSKILCKFHQTIFWTKWLSNGMLWAFCLLSEVESGWGTSNFWNRGVTQIFDLTMFPTGFGSIKRFTTHQQWRFWNFSLGLLEDGNRLPITWLRDVLTISVINGCSGTWPKCSYSICDWTCIVVDKGRKRHASEPFQ